MAVTIRLRAPAMVLATIPATKAAAMVLAMTAAMVLAMTAATGRTMGRRIPPRMIMTTVLLEPVRRMGADGLSSGGADAYDGASGSTSGAY